MKHIEETLLLVKNKIVASIAAKITAINTEKGDSVVLTAPLTRNYSINELGAISDYPFIQFVPDNTDTVLSTPDADEDTHNIIIKAHNVTKLGSIEDCAIRTYRYARILSEIIKENRTLTNQVIAWWRTNTNYQPMMTDGNGFKQEVWIHCSVKHFGTFT